MTYSGSPNPDPGEVKRDEETLQRQRDEKAEQDRLEEERRILEQEVPFWKRQKQLEGDEFTQDPEGPHYQSIAAETGIGIATDFATVGLLGIPLVGQGLYYGTNFAVGYSANALAQWMRGDWDNFSQGEALAAGGYQTIPMGTTAKGLKGLRRAAAKGAVGGAGMAQLEVGIDERRRLTGKELALSSILGGTVAGGFKGAELGGDLVGDVIRNPYQLAPEGSLARMLGDTGGGIVPPPSDEYQKQLTKFYAGENVQFPVRVLDEVPQDIRSTMAWESGLVDGVFDFDRWLSKSLYGKRFRSRTTVAKMQAAYGTDVNFETYRDNVLLPQFIKEWGPILDKLKIPRSSLQAHHIFAIRASAGLYDGLQFGSKEWVDVTNTLLKKYIRPGDMPKNLMPLVGSTADKNTPHYITHRYIDEIIGPTGETFFTKEVRKEMKKNHKFRIKKTLEFAEKMKTAEGVAVQAQKVWDRIYGPGQVIPEELVEELSALPMQVNPKYRTDVKLEELVRQVFSQIKEFPFPESMSRKEFLKNWLPQFEGKGFEALRRMFEIDLDLTPEQAMETPLGYRLQKYLQTNKVKNRIKKKVVKRKKK